MRAAQMRRHLGAVRAALPRTARSPLSARAGLSPQAHALKAIAPATPQNLEFSPRDYITYLLSIDAEIEHCLMVQYLYAAYSVGGPDVPEDQRAMVRGWQEVILGIAKEEMGHLISVQNVLRVIGAPLHMEREDYPWDMPFYPFPFTLEPLTMDSLAKYVYTESAVGWDGGELGAEIRAAVHAQTDDPHKVGELFALLLKLLQDPDYLPDSAFQPETCACQANWAEWGRGYAGGSRGNSSGASPAKTPDVLVVPVTCRDDVVNALTQISEQGEATLGSQPSHFVRFFQIWCEMRNAIARQPVSLDLWVSARPADFKADTWASFYPVRAGVPVTGAPWSPSRQVAVNPYVALDPEYEPELGDAPTTHITNTESALWATLHNLRYRMLLTYLIHTFTLYGGLNMAGTITPRGAIVNATFGEMYNLRAISEILMNSPATDDPADGFAGPPFQMPYTLNSPFGEANRWRAHLDLLSAAEGLIAALLEIAPSSRHTYLNSLREADKNMITIANRILQGSVDAALL